jgi:hypothetical protein
MPRVGFETMTPAFKRAKKVHALDLTATLTSHHHYMAQCKQVTQKCIWFQVISKHSDLHQIIPKN